MINFVSKNEGDFYQRLNVKIFVGTPQVVECDLQKFIKSEPMEIEEIKQTESGGTHTFSITVTIFYFTLYPAWFIRKSDLIEEIKADFEEYIESYYNVSYDKILDFCFKNRRHSSGTQEARQKENKE